MHIKYRYFIDFVGKFVFFVQVLLSNVVSADSFQAQFSNATYYGLAIAGISLGAAMGAALLGLLIFCLVRRQRRKQTSGKKFTPSDTEATNSTNSRVGNAGAASNFGPMALPGVATLTGGVGAGSGGRLKNGIRNVSGGGSSGADSGGRRQPTLAAQYTNPAFASSTDRGIVMSATNLYRNSSLLRPVPYTASLESNISRGSGGAISSVPVIQHQAVRTSPASTLDPRTFLSQDGLNGQRARLAALPTGPSDQSKRLSYAEPQRPASQKRLSYAEQRAQTGSNVELVSGQIFASSSTHLSAGYGQGRSLPRVLPTQPEEDVGVRKKPPAPKPPSTQPLEEGPSFPKTATRSMSFAKQQQQQQQQQTALDEQDQAVVPRHHQSLHRIHLGGGEDGRSVTSTVLKQEAIQAFEFLENYD